VDALTDVLEVARVSGSALAHVHAHEPWGLDLSLANGAACHAVTAGSVWLEVEGEPARRLMPGDVVLLPRPGLRHLLLSAPGVAARRYGPDLKAELLTAAGDLVIPGPGSPSRFLCAGFSYDNELAHPLLSLLPPVLHVSATDEGPDTPLQSTLRLLMGELSRHQVGSEAAVERLIEVLFVHAIRSWLDTSANSTPPSWLTGLRDAVIARALGLLHSQPERAWTIDELAAAVHVSRSTLVRRFNDLVGEPPAAYLAHWRMELAARLLRESEQPVGRISHLVGYTSEFAFSRAFTKHRGEPPGRYRKRIQSTPGV
jgi:AraC-like DNA-binding protein